MFLENSLPSAGLVKNKMALNLSFGGKFACWDVACLLYRVSPREISEINKENSVDDEAED